MTISTIEQTVLANNLDEKDINELVEKAVGKLIDEKLSLFLNRLQNAQPNPTQQLFTTSSLKTQTVTQKTLIKNYYYLFV